MIRCLEKYQTDGAQPRIGKAGTTIQCPGLMIADPKEVRHAAR
jgi:hypothetical protein